MNILPVIDLKAGQAVQAVAGRRHEYQPVASVLCTGSRPADLAVACATKLGARDLYVADLDALAGAPPAVATLAEIAAAGPRLWIDAGLDTPARLRHLTESCRDFPAPPIPIVALETLPAGPALEQLVEAAGPLRGQLAFSLDLKEGRPLARAAEWAALSPLEIARHVAELGLTRLIVLDLSSVGAAAGPSTLPLCRELRSELPALEIITGGGIRGSADLAALAAAGCWGALLGTALHRGQITAADFPA